MKKKVLLLAAMALMSCGIAKAQDDFNTGKWAIEMEVQPNFNASDWFLPNLTLGYNLDNGGQIYAQLELETHGFNQGTVGFTGGADDEDYDNHYKNNYFKGTYGTVTISFGYQHFFIKEGRFRPFVNAGVGFGYSWAHMKAHRDYYHIDDWYQADCDINGIVCDDVNDLIDDNDLLHLINNASLTAMKGFTLDISVGAGFDFYIYKGLYVGAELGLSYDMTWTGNATYKYSSNDPHETEQSYNGEVALPFWESEGSHWVTPMIRLGWRF